MEKGTKITPERLLWPADPSCRGFRVTHCHVQPPESTKANAQGWIHVLLRSWRDPAESSSTLHALAQAESQLRGQEAAWIGYGEAIDDSDSKRPPSPPH